MSLTKVLHLNRVIQPATATISTAVGKALALGRRITVTTTVTPAIDKVVDSPPGTFALTLSRTTTMTPTISTVVRKKKSIPVVTVVGPAVGRLKNTGSGTTTYTKPTPNTDPNNFGTVDVTLDPSMSAATIQSKISTAGPGGVIEWAGSSHYQINTVLKFYSGQKHFTNNGRIIKCTNTSGFDAFVNLKAGGGGQPATDVTISDLEFWGHVNVPNNPPTTAPHRVMVLWTRTFLRRVKVKGGREFGALTSGDHVCTGVVVDTCEFSYNTHTPTQTGVPYAGFKVNEFGDCGVPIGQVLKVHCTHIHHNGGNGLWADISCGGIQWLANEVDHNGNYGMFWEECGGPVLIRDNYSHDNFHQGIFVISGDNGRIINNTLGGNGDWGIALVQDMDPPSRSSLHCPQRGGLHDGYWFADWDVLGNVLNGDAVNNFTISSPAVNYSTTHYPDNKA